mmetsp:Transcript_118104/g.204097  ORF Transcript_118104/g.204097 Transcript_118104/m.204097 type:complete len:306 (-) Transcript_118104:245-1162(-)
MHGAAAGAANAETFVANECTRMCEGITIVTLEPHISSSPFKHSRDEVIADTFHMVHLALPLIVEILWKCQDRPLRINTNDGDMWSFLLDLFSNACQSTSSASSHYQMSELTVSLFQDLFRCCVVVCKNISSISVLIQDMCACTSSLLVYGFFDALCENDVRIVCIPSSLRGSSQDECAKAFHHVYLLTGHLLWKSDDNIVAFDCPSHAESDTGVAAGGLNEGVPWLAESVPLCLLDHTQSNAILHGTPSREVLALSQNCWFNAKQLSIPIQANHWSISNQFQSTVCNLGWTLLAWWRGVSSWRLR